MKSYDEAFAAQIASFEGRDFGNGQKIMLFYMVRTIRKEDEVMIVQNDDGTQEKWTLKAGEVNNKIERLVVEYGVPLGFPKELDGLIYERNNAGMPIFHTEEYAIKTGQLQLTNFESVGRFMRAFGQEVKTSPELPSEDVQKLRFKLIDEELNEFVQGLENKDIVEVADALTDILYVVYGAGHAFGIDLDACFAEVHRTNMAKLGPDGKPIRREDGKVLKPEGWKPPQLRDVLFGKEKDDGVSEGQGEA